MAALNTNQRRTDPEYNHLLNYFIEKAKDAKSPISIKRTAKEFKEKSGAAQTRKSLEARLRKKVPSFSHIDTNTKVKLLFALSASVDASFLKKKTAVVEVDEKNRIKKYEAIDGSLKLNGDHSVSAKTKTAMIGSKRSHQKMIPDYFESKNKTDAVPKNKKEKEMWNLIEFITEKCENVISPLTILRLAKDFNKKFRTSRPLVSIFARIKRYCREIQRVEFLDTQSKVKQLFGLSATVDLDCLEKLRKNALVEVDHKNRIIKYTANDDSLTLRGSHWGSGETTPKRVKKTNKNNVATTADDSEEESDHERFNDSSDEYSSEEFGSEFDSDEENNPLDETENLMDPSNKVDEFNNETPVRNRSPTEFSNADNFDFDLPTERTSQPEENEMRENEENENDSEITGNSSMKTRSGRLSKRRHLNSEFSYNLANSRTAATPRSTDSSSSKPAKQKKIAIEREQGSSSSNQSTKSSRQLKRSIGKSPSPSISTEGRIEWKKKINAVKKHCHSDVDKDDENKKRNNHLENGDDEYSREGFDSQLHSKNDKDSLDKTEDLLESSTVDFGNETPVRSRSPPRNSIVNDDRDEDSSEEFDSEFDSDDENNHLDETKDLAARSSIQSGSSSRSTRRSSRDSYFPSFATDVPGDNPSDYQGPTDHEMEDYEYNPKEDNTPESLAIDNRLREPVPSAAEDHNTNIEDQNILERSDAVASELHPENQSLALQKETNSTPPTNGSKAISQEVPIKIENGEPMIVEDPTEDVKPVTAHNAKIKFFEAMKSLIIFLDTPSLSNLQSKIHQKIRKMKGSKEVLQNNELIPALELLVARMANYSVIDISKSVESVSLIQFLCYLKASLLNSKMIGVEGLMNKISGLIEKSQNKRIQMEKVANALRATLDIDSF